MTFATVCTGIGGLDLGLERAGMNPLWFCEIEKNPSKVLTRHWPTIRNLNDLTKIDTNGLERPDVLGGGTPCTGFSLAGGRACMSDERSALAFHFVRLADELQPEFVVWENVPGVLCTPDNSFGTFLAALAGTDAPLVPPGTIKRWNGDRFSWPDAGMVAGPKRNLAWRVLDSQYFGLAQRRERVFVVASSRNHDPSQILFECPRLRRNPPKIKGAGNHPSPTADGGFDEWDEGCRKVAHTIASHAAKGGDPTTDNYVIQNGNVRPITPTECARLSGFPDDWCGELSDAGQYRAYGNCINVPVAEWIGRRIKRACQVPSTP